MNVERIEVTPFALVVGDILRARATGELTVARGTTRRVLYWFEGELVLITSTATGESLGEFLARRGIISAGRASLMFSQDPLDAAVNFHNSGLADASQREALLADWLGSLLIPLFSLSDGTSAFTDDAGLEAPRRIPCDTRRLVIAGIRAISNGLVLRRSLGDLRSRIVPGGGSALSLSQLPLSETEQKIAASLAAPITIDAFLKSFASDSVIAAKVVVIMRTLGLFALIDATAVESAVTTYDQMQHDLELLARIGGNDPRSLHALGLSRKLPTLDHYQLLELPRRATRADIVARVEVLQRQFDPTSYPVIVREAVLTVQRRLAEASSVLADPEQRASYDRMLASGGGHLDDRAMRQQIAQRTLADQNISRGRELAARGDYYGAIVLLQQAVRFTPENAGAWHLLGECQSKNPNWRRRAIESFENALKADPNAVDTVLALGDVYAAEGIAPRARECYAEALKIDPQNAKAKEKAKR